MRKQLFKRIVTWSLCLAVGAGLLAGSQAEKVQAKEKHFCYIGLECENPPANFPEDGYIYRYSAWEE